MCTACAMATTEEGELGEGVTLVLLVKPSPGVVNPGLGNGMQWREESPGKIDHTLFSSRSLLLEFCERLLSPDVQRRMRVAGEARHSKSGSMHTHIPGSCMPGIWPACPVTHPDGWTAGQE